MHGVCAQIKEAKARLDQKKGDMESLEAEVQRANERAKELEDEARKARLGSSAASALSRASL